MFYDKPFLKFERLLETYLAFAPRGLALVPHGDAAVATREAVSEGLLRNELQALRAPDFDWDRRLLFTEHHLSHAASAFFPSPFEEAAVLTMDGVGEWAPRRSRIGRGNQLEIIKEIHFPHSLGLLYSAFTYYTGFKVNSGEYKVMGLAPYGEPRYAQHHPRQPDRSEGGRLVPPEPGILRLLHRPDDDQRRVRRCSAVPPRKPDELLTQRHMDLAASIQAVLEEVVLRLTRSLAAETGAKNLCLAGGVALNCVANGKVLRDGRFERIWIQPAAGDAGGALGAALAAYYFIAISRARHRQRLDAMQGAYLGPAFDTDEIEGG